MSEIYGLQGSITLKNDNWVTAFGHPASLNSWYFEWSFQKQEDDKWKISIRAEGRNSQTKSYAYGGFSIRLIDGQNEETIFNRSHGSGMTWNTSDNNDKYNEEKEFIPSWDLGGTVKLQFIGTNSSASDEYKAEQTIDIYLYEYIPAPQISTSESNYISGAQDFTIEWTRVENTTNPFANYQIIVQIGDETNESTTTDNSYTFTKDQLQQNRGKKALIQICSNGENDSYVPEGISREYATYETKINNLPILSITSTGKILPSNTDTNQIETIEVAGFDSDIGQEELSYYYSISNGEKIECSNTIEISVSQLQNYLFFAFDGLEYSEPQSSNIVLNTPPTFDINYTYTKEESVNLANDQEYVTYLKMSNTPSGGQYSSTYKYTIYYGENKENISQYKVFETSEDNVIISDIRDYVPNGNYYKISITRNDGIEEYTETIDKIFYVTETPKIHFLISEDKKHTNNNVTYYHFDDSLIVYVDYDTGYNNLNLLYSGEFNLLNNQTSIPLTQCPIDDNKQRYYYSLEFQRQNSGGYLTGSLTAQLDARVDTVNSINVAQVSQIVLSNLDASLTYKPYTAEFWEMAFGVSDGLDADNKIYGFYDHTPTPKLILSYNEKISEFSDLTKEASSSNTTLIYSANGSSLYEALEGLSLNKNGSTTIKAYVQYTNDFGQISVSNSLNLNVDYREDIEKISGDVKSGVISLADWEYLKEGVRFDAIDLAFKTYNALSKIIIYYKCGSTTRQIYEFEIDNTEISAIGYNAPYTMVEQSTFEYYIPLITQDIMGEFFVDFVRADGSISTVKLIEKQFYRHIEPSTSFASINYDAAEEVLSMEFLTSDFGAPEGLIDSYQWSIKEQDSDDMTSINGSEVDYTISRDFVYLAPCLSTTFSAKYKTANGKTDKAFETTKAQSSFVYTIVYNLLPTVSYRQNHLGINTLAPSKYSNSAIYIGTYGERDTIYFIGNDDSIKTLNVATGATSGFIVDGGSWDDVPGHIVPSTGGGGDAPISLANIAYTGEFSDLLQKRDDIIIISGGSAPI